MPFLNFIPVPLLGILLDIAMRRDDLLDRGLAHLDDVVFQRCLRQRSRRRWYTTSRCLFITSSIRANVCGGHRYAIQHDFLHAFFDRTEIQRCSIGTLSSIPIWPIRPAPGGPAPKDSQQVIFEWSRCKTARSPDYPGARIFRATDCRCTTDSAWRSVPRICGPPTSQHLARARPRIAPCCCAYFSSAAWSSDPSG